MTTFEALPDIAATPTQQHGILDWVGMSGIHLPIHLQDSWLTDAVDASADVFVDLADAEAKGIHMSRLYLQLQRFASEQQVTARSLRRLLDAMLLSHSELSGRAGIVLRFNHLQQQGALKSEHSGWRSYPVVVSGQLDEQGYQLELRVTVQYSSTCPCSAALARQLIVQQFQHDFGGHPSVDADTVANWLASEQGILATPHSQRSNAHIRIQLSESADNLPLQALINSAEQALQTPVQAAVKREDEQEFARLNGQNLMFCEDAARRLRYTLDSQIWIADFAIRVEHMESLHAHDAVSVVVKGVPGGYRPNLL